MSPRGRRRFRFAAKGRPEGDRRQAPGCDGARRQRAPSGDQLRITVRLPMSRTAISCGRSATTGVRAPSSTSRRRSPKPWPRVWDRPRARTPRSRTSFGTPRIRRRITCICADDISGIREPRARCSGHGNSSRRRPGRTRTTCCRGWGWRTSSRFNRSMDSSGRNTPTRGPWTP